MVERINYFVKNSNVVKSYSKEDPTKPISSNDNNKNVKEEKNNNEDVMLKIETLNNGDKLKKIDMVIRENNGFIVYFIVDVNDRITKMIFEPNDFINQKHRETLEDIRRDLKLKENSVFNLNIFSKLEKLNYKINKYFSEHKKVVVASLIIIGIVGARMTSEDLKDMEDKKEYIIKPIKTEQEFREELEKSNIDRDEEIEKIYQTMSITLDDIEKEKNKSL